MKSGFISIIGRTNAGKSSLINYLLGEQICMVSHKANATRRKISAIVMHKENQIIFNDTPGLHKSNKILNQAMVELALKSIGDADLVLFLATIHDKTDEYEEFVSSFDMPHILVLTKIDESDDKKLFLKMDEYSKFKDKFLALIPITIKKGAYRNILLDEIVKYLPKNPYFYDSELISYTNTRDIYRDFILQAIFESVSSEVPYATDVIIQKIDSKDELISVYADIITDNESHKKILIGKNGATIKRIGIKAKKLISGFENRKIFINLQVNIKKMWNLDKNLIKKDFIY